MIEGETAIDGPLYAHTTESGKETWEPLHDHLRNVAIGDSQTPGAVTLAEPFDAGPMAALAGWLHDIGKSSSAFQTYIGNIYSESSSTDTRARVDHSTAGARIAETLGPFGRLVAYAIAGHHAGLPDYQGSQSSLSARLDPNRRTIEPFDASVVPDIARQLSQPPPKLPEDFDLWGVAVAMLGRMVFSTLVDADSLWTERFVQGGPIAERTTVEVDFQAMIRTLDDYLGQKASSSSSCHSPVNRIRREVLEQCKDAAILKPGFFSLHVPTGGGKTLSSMAFALRHASEHSLRRIIYAIPLTTIIEQTASEFRTCFGDNAVLEHHSNVDPNDDQHSRARSMASENFNASLIVTTNVQILETLFAHRRSKCRKLHQIAGSVIIFDEVQTLPVNLLQPTLAALRVLVECYGCTIVLCSATQPALQHRVDFPIGLQNVRSIIPDPIRLHKELRRTRVQIIDQTSNENLSDRLSQHNQALCIVNSKRHATDLASLIDDCIHLSTAMCPAHRRAVVADIRRRLIDGQTCRVVSTTVMEAGVDVDFPVVYRAEAGLDSIAQAAGRCNRHGLRPVEDVYVFEYDHSVYPTVSIVKQGIEFYRMIRDQYADDLLAPEAIEHYFKLLYWNANQTGRDGWDRGVGGSVMKCFGDAAMMRDGRFEFQYAQASDRYRLINENQQSVLVPYVSPESIAPPNGIELIAELTEASQTTVDSGWLRSLDQRSKPFCVNVYAHALHAMRETGAITELHGRLYLNNADAYDETVGLVSDVAGIGIDQLSF